jgi:hypothetical protein
MTTDSDAIETRSSGGGSAAPSRSSMGRSGVSSGTGSKRRWRTTPSTFSEIDAYEQRSARGRSKSTATDEEEVPEDTFVDKLKANSHIIGVMSFLMLLTLIGSSFMQAALWLSAIQVFGIFASALRWENDQWMARSGKYGCRLICQFFIVIIPGFICGMLIFVASTFPVAILSMRALFPLSTSA